MKKLFILATFGAIALTSCTSDDFVGDSNALKSGEGAISFNMNTATLTRAEQTHTASAATLNNQFIVWGEKSTGSAAETSSAGTPVFINYVVNYGASTARTTESNSSDWEYVGQTPYAAAKVTSTGSPATVSTQTIKYWDFTNKNYTFTAISALPGDISGDKVTVTKNVSGTTVYDKGYTVALKEGASVNDIYFSDRTLVEAGEATKSSPVTLHFRNLVSQVRFGFYETVPGYSVAITDVKFNSASHTADGADKFGVDCSGAVLVPGASTSFTVTYDDGSVIAANQNKAKVAVAGSNTQDYLSTTATGFFGTTLGTASNESTWENGGNYTKILPNPSNTTDLTLTISYRLTSTDNSGETIDITDAVAKVPAAYAKWQSNYAYTYLFKITDKNGLYPITFDAVVVEDEAGNQETITTVDTPSITTYAKGEMVTANNEYVTGNTIYAAVEDAAVDPSNPTLTVGTNAKLYFVTLESGAAQTITEASVANALVNGTTNATDKTWTVTDALTKKMVVTDTESNLLTAITQIPAADSPTGADLSIKGAKFAPAAKYVQVPENTDLTEGITYYTSDAGAGGAAAGASAKAGASTYRKVSDAIGAYVFEYIRGNVYEAATGTYVAGTKYYTDANGSSEVDTTSFEVGVTDVSSYFVLASPAVKTYKVIKVVAAP